MAVLALLWWCLRYACNSQSLQAPRGAAFHTFSWQQCQQSSTPSPKTMVASAIGQMKYPNIKSNPKAKNETKTNSQLLTTVHLQITSSSLNVFTESRIALGTRQAFNGCFSWSSRQSDLFAVRGYSPFSFVTFSFYTSRKLSHVELVTMNTSDSHCRSFLGFCLLDVCLMFNYNLPHNVLICISFGCET